MEKKRFMVVEVVEKPLLEEGVNKADARFVKIGVKRPLSVINVINSEVFNMNFWKI